MPTGAERAPPRGSHLGKHGSVSCKRLQVRQGHAITDESVIVGIARLGQGCLRIHHFESVGFTGLIAQQGQAQALGGEIGGLAQRVDLRLGGLGFPIEDAMFPCSVRWARFKSSSACCCLSAACFTLLRMRPQFQTGMFMVAWATSRDFAGR